MKQVAMTYANEIITGLKYSHVSNIGNGDSGAGTRDER